MGCLKRELRRLHNFPICLQLLLHNSNVLHDSTKLDASLDIQLVLLSNCTDLQKEAESELLYAGKNGRAEIAKSLLEARVHPDSSDGTDRTALVHAALHGHVEVVQLLLGADADMHWMDERGNTALTYALAKGHAQIARALLEAGLPR